MNLQQLQYILAVAESKHFEKAASKCFITQSTLSTMILKFEEEIGIKIFDRKTKPVLITKEGEEIIKHLQIITKEIKSLENKVQELKGEITGEFKIGIIPTVAPYLLPLFLSEFVNKFSKVKIVVQEMTTLDIQKSLKNRSLDIGIAAIPLEDPELKEYILYNEQFMLFDCFNDRHDKSHINLTNMDYSHLILLEEGHCLRTQVRKICNLSKKYSENLTNFEFRAGSIDSLIRFTKSYKGITLLPYMATIDLQKEDKDRLKSLAFPVPIRSIGLIVHQHFVKKRLLEELSMIIQSSVLPLISTPSESKLIKPL